VGLSGVTLSSSSEVSEVLGEDEPDYGGDEWGYEDDLPDPDIVYFIIILNIIL